ncbi:MAG: glycosyltransferase family 25 protein [Phycisphaeraceae bacterium]|nr:glycosyltransferase family 25 protein [Phycisphaeraceae bacterium]
MSSALDAFDRIVCINLDERTDRWAQVQQTTAALLGEVKIERFSAVKPDLAQDRVHNGRAGCLLSHRRVIENAYRDGLESVLVLEDDLCFDPQFEALIKPTVATLTQTPWDLFYLGITAKTPLLPAGNGLVRTYGGTTTHAIAYHRRAIPDLLKRLPDEDTVLRFLSRYKSVDRYYWQQVAPRMRCYAASPLLAFQRDDFSDIQQAEMRSNQQQSREAFEQRLIKDVTPLKQAKLRVQGACNTVKHQIDGYRRMLLRPIKAK